MAWGPGLHRKEEKREATSTLYFLVVDAMGLAASSSSHQMCPEGILTILYALVYWLLI